MSDLRLQQLGPQPHCRVKIAVQQILQDELRVVVVADPHQQPGARDLSALARFGDEIDQAARSLRGIRCQQRIKEYGGQQFCRQGSGDQRP